MACEYGHTGEHGLHGKGRLMSPFHTISHHHRRRHHHHRRRQSHPSSWQVQPWLQEQPS